MGKSVCDLVKPLEGHVVSRIKLGYGSFITIDFGKNRVLKYATKHGIKQRERGEWRIWIYMCAWRIDKNQKPFLGSEDDFSREVFQEKLSEIKGKKLLSFDILNTAFDSQIKFESDFAINLFSFGTQKEQWILFRPEKKVLTVGPGDRWVYRNEDE